ncbi:hypothetical protein [Arthrobacter sp. CJ23]|uniref:hypothetical protein n=1 Tax=Arthrobacter sp. CJ23 TaxID=2972479 RepID=UPI00215CEC4A|nr:hypothetical protein [Arthrobacter sp. CJ23]UVJ40478.1 hypothetical protein NVV90_04695 [Arthrobacter sp. CJ23]
MEAARKHARPARMLRSILIAAAGTGLWMVLSASAATADSGNSLLDGLSSTVSSATGTAGGAGGPLTATAKLLAPAPVAPAPAPETSAVTQLSETVDATVADAVPGVVVLAEPVLDAVVAPLVQGTVTPVVEDVVVPVLQPVAEVVDLLVPPVVVPGVVPESVVPDVAGEVLGTAFQTRTDGSGPQPGMLAQELKGPAGSLVAGAPPSWKFAPGGIEHWPATGQHSRSVPGGNSPIGLPNWPAGNAAGAGSGNGPAGGSAASAAWLQGGFALPPLSGDGLAVEAAQHLPAPVSFDPGSSPD